jgi:phytoene dehydrogenase-like protein
LFGGRRARALIAGLAAHSARPLGAPLTSAFAVLMAAAGHAVGWPFASGGANRLAEALASHARHTGIEIETNAPVISLQAPAGVGVVLCDLMPQHVVRIAGDTLPARYRRSLARFQYGPGAFKLDWALAGPIPWRAEACRRAGTLHLGGTFEEIAQAEHDVARGHHPDRPFVLLAQPSICDPTRAPLGRHTAWAYCHVPNGSTVDMTARIERQIERFAPGFQDLILARHSMGPEALEAHNPNLVGGDLTGGVPTMRQTFSRPTWRHYRTPVPWLYLCSAATPPGGGVHGMCGYHAAEVVLRDSARRR